MEIVSSSFICLVCCCAWYMVLRLEVRSCNLILGLSLYFDVLPSILHNLSRDIACAGLVVYACARRFLCERCLVLRFWIKYVLSNCSCSGVSSGVWKGFSVRAWALLQCVNLNAELMAMGTIVHHVNLTMSFMANKQKKNENCVLFPNLIFGSIEEFLLCSC